MNFSNGCNASNFSSKSHTGIYKQGDCRKIPIETRVLEIEIEIEFKLLYVRMVLEGTVLTEVPEHRIF